MSSATAGYRKKTFAETWLSTSGVNRAPFLPYWCCHNRLTWLMSHQAYPVMGVIAFAVIFSTSAGIYLGVNTPDARVSKISRKSLFRGGTEEEIFAKVWMKYWILGSLWLTECWIEKFEIYCMIPEWLPELFYFNVTTTISGVLFVPRNTQRHVDAWSLSSSSL